MTEQIEMRSLKEVMEKIREIDKRIENGKYSLDDTVELRYLAIKLKEMAKRIEECCY